MEPKKFKIPLCRIAGMVGMEEGSLSSLLRKYPPQHPAIHKAGTGRKAFWETTNDQVDTVVAYLIEHRQACRARGEQARIAGLKETAQRKRLAKATAAAQPVALPMKAATKAGAPTRDQRRLDIVWERVSYLCRERGFPGPDEMLAKQQGK
jgi:hypothetical protein